MPTQLESTRDGQLDERRESLRVATQDATSRALRWFASTVDAGMKGFDFAATCTALFGVCCALRICPHPAGSVASELRERIISGLLDSLNLRASETVQGFRRGGFIPALMAASSLDMSSLEGDRYTEIVVQEWERLKNQRGVDTSSLSYWTAGYLASLLTKQTSPPPPKLIAGPWLSPLFRYTASPSQIQQVSQLIAAASTFGNTAFAIGDECCHQLEELLLFWAFYFAKERDLDMICPVLRSLEYLACTSAPEFCDGLEVVVLQCKRDGRFGMHEMAARLYGPDIWKQLTCDREIYLPLTVAGIWTLLECTRPDLSPFRNASAAA
jgi:hypothetical protein